VAGPDDPPDDPTSRPPADEPRAGDVARAKSTADLEDKLDPATIAQLASWFALPSFAELEERRKAEEPQVDEVDEARKERRARIEEVADRQLLANMERWKTAGDPLIHLPPQMEIKIGGDIRANITDVTEGMGSLAEPREREMPHWMEEDLRETAPQAILRDLHRPELDFNLYFEQIEHQPTLSEMRGVVTATLGMSLRIRPDLRPALESVRDAFAEVRHWKAARWDELPLPKREPEAES
jgi:hypothetical protein